MRDRAYLPRTAIVALLLVAGCITADVLRLDPVVRPQTDPATIRVLATEPAVPYTVIALVSASSDSRGVEALRERLVKEAAKLGGDAILLDAESLARTDYRRLLSAKVIVFEQP